VLLRRLHLRASLLRDTNSEFDADVELDAVPNEHATASLTQSQSGSPTQTQSASQSRTQSQSPEFDADHKCDDNNVSIRDSFTDANKNE